MSGRRWVQKRKRPASVTPSPAGPHPHSPWQPIALVYQQSRGGSWVRQGCFGSVEGTLPPTAESRPGVAIYSRMPLKRNCPSCGAELVYANVPGYRRSRRLNSLCRSCAASPSVVQRKLADDQEMAAKKTGGNFMAAFFGKIQASLSGSR
jgi:hypothetical protein